MGVRASDKVIRCTLSRKRSESEILEIRSSFRGWAEVDLASVIEDDDLVEKIVDTLSRLIEADEGGLAENIRHDPQTLDEIQGSTRVEPTRRVVPGLDTSPGCHHLGDRDPFPLTTTNTRNELVTDESGLGVGDIEHP